MAAALAMEAGRSGRIKLRDPCTSPRSTANQAAKEVAAKSTKTYSHIVAGRSRGPFRLLL